jgi:hypothetical protein
MAGIHVPARRGRMAGDELDHATTHEIFGVEKRQAGDAASP